MRLGFVTVVLVLALAGTAQAADGDLDPAFGGGDGFGVFEVGPDEHHRDVAVDPLGRTVVVGSVLGSFSIARFLPNGELDPEFGGNGRTSVNFTGNDHAHAVAIQPDGKIVVAGVTDRNPDNSGQGDDNFAVVRLTDDGEEDPSFNNVATPNSANGDGKVTIDFGDFGDEDQAFDVALGPGGKIVLGGGLGIGTAGADFAAIRLLPDGKPDPDFNNGIPQDGQSVISVGADDVARAVAVQDDGKVVLAGSTTADATGDNPQSFGIVRLHEEGVHDEEFNGGPFGGRIVDFGFDDQATALVIQPDGKVVVGGTTEGGGSGNFALARLRGDDGELDTTFNDVASPTVSDGDGKLNIGSFGSGGTDELLADLVLQGEGKLFAVGQTDAVDDPDNVAVAQVRLDGTLDTSFSGDGRHVAQLLNDQDIAGAAVQADGKVVIVGETNQERDAATPADPDIGLPNMFLARMLAPPPPAISISDASVTEGNAGTAGAVFTVSLSKPSAKTVRVGFSTAPGTAGSGSDFDPASGTLTFAPGDTSKTAVANVRGDVQVEGAETFVMNLAGAQNALVADAQGIGTILNDDLFDVGVPGNLAPRFTRAIGLSEKTFVAANSGPSVRPAQRLRPVGTRVSYRLSERASVSWRVQRRTAGRRVGGRCRKPSAGNRNRPRCTRFVTLRGSFATQGKAGQNSFRFTGRLRGRKLAPGRYRLVATATDSTGRRSAPARATFRIVPQR